MAEVVKDKINNMKLSAKLRVEEVKQNPKIILKWLGSAWVAIKNGVHHTYVGFKLLYYDTKVASVLLGRVISGNTLKRRERQLLLHTAEDLLRLIPFSFFIIIPFAELALPFALRLFPNMLPSTFADKDEKKAIENKVLQGRLEIAHFLQEVVETKSNSIVEVKDSVHRKDAERLNVLMNRLKSGQNVDTLEFQELTKFFRDELTLENLNRPQLTAMCNYMNIKPIGNETMLRFQLRHQIQRIKRDDREIHWEGVESLTLEELKSAARKRGIKAAGRNEKELRSNLKGWITLSMDREVPSTLLILSQALQMGSSTAAKPAGLSANADEHLDGIKAAIKSMPEEVVRGVNSDKASLADRLEVVKRELKVVQEENKADVAKEKEKEKIAKASSEGSSPRNTLKVAREAAEVAAEAAVAAAAVGEADAVDLHQLRATSKVLESMGKDEGDLRSQALDKAWEFQEKIKENVDTYDPLIARIDKMLDKVEAVVEKDSLDAGDAQSPEAAAKRAAKAQFTIKELESNLKKNGGADHAKLLKAVDLDNDGIISRSDVESLIKLLDMNNDGVLTMAELKMYLQMISNGADQQVVLKLLTDAAEHRRAVKH